VRRENKTDAGGRLYSSVRQVVPVSPTPPMFVGGATSPTNIVHVYSSVTLPHSDEYIGRVKVKPDESYIRGCPPYIRRFKYR
jgi:hypothetical protein